MENYRDCCYAPDSDFKAKKAPNSISAGAQRSPRPPADPIPALGPPITCLPKYVSLNPPMTLAIYMRRPDVRGSRLRGFFNESEADEKGISDSHISEREKTKASKAPYVLQR